MSNKYSSDGQMNESNSEQIAAWWSVRVYFDRGVVISTREMSPVVPLFIKQAWFGSDIISGLFGF